MSDPKHVRVSPATTDCCKRAVEAWGEKAQLLMMMEEMGELAVALSHNLRGRSNHLEVTEEVADVLFMALQMRELFGKKLVDEQLHKKLVRLRGRLEARGSHMQTTEKDCF